MRVPAGVARNRTSSAARARRPLEQVALGPGPSTAKVRGELVRYGWRLCQGGGVAEVDHERVAPGELETEVLEVLWQAGRPCNPGEVRAALNRPLAYTTVLTTLRRLWKKGVVEREADRRGYKYTAGVSEAELMATRMRAVMASSSDSTAVLSRFIGTLSSREAALARKMLDELRRR